jgi:hypothetical protein
MLRLTLRTLLAYIDDTLDPAEARDLGTRVAASPEARDLMDRIKRVTRRRGLQTPAVSDREDPADDANTVAQYLSNTLPVDQVALFEQACLNSDVHLAEAAACHQILTVVLTEPVRVPPRANQRMYGLVEPPAAQPGRKPGKAIPVGGMPVTESGEADDADAALLLGMRRYAAGPRAGRLGLAAAAVGLAVLLAVAVVMALPHRDPTPPPTAPDQAVAANPTSAPAPPRTITQPNGATTKGPKSSPAVDAGRTVAPMPRLVAAGKAKPPVIPAAKGEQPLANKVPAPVDGGDRAGFLATENVLVLARKPDPAAGWVRLAAGDKKDAKKPVAVAPGSVVPGDTILCLPGYKCEVRTDNDLSVRLWGNVPELLPPDSGEGHVALEARVRFHTPPDGFDADLTLLTGRVYLKTRKPGGSRVRVRAAGEVFDVTLPDPTADVMAELVYFYPPGTPYVRGKADAPRADLKLAVVGGSATIAAPGRARTFERVAAPALIARDPRTEQLADPIPLPPDKFWRFDPYLTWLEGRQGVEVQRAQSALAGMVATPDGVMGTLSERLNDRPEKPADRVIAMTDRTAVYAEQAVMAEGPPGNGLKLLVDRLDELLRGYIRPAAATALSAWLAQDPGNSDRLRAVLAAGEYGEDADVVVQLLRGAVTLPAVGGKFSSDELDRLVGLLNHKSIAVRQLALANLLTYVDRLGPDADVAMPAELYTKFVADWRNRVKEARDRPYGSTPKKPEPAKKADEGKK